VEFAVTPERVARASFYNLSLHQAAEANEVGYFGTVSKGSLLEWVDRMYTTPATFADRTVGKWINAVMARGDFLALESRLQLSFKRFGLSCAEPLKHTEFDEYEPRAGCPETRTPYHAPAARDGRAPLRDDQGPHGSDALLDEDAAACLGRDGPARPRLQSHPRQ
jgi:hypothetical protein